MNCRELLRACVVGSKAGKRAVLQEVQVDDRAQCGAQQLSRNRNIVARKLTAQTVCYLG